MERADLRSSFGLTICMSQYPGVVSMLRISNELLVATYWAYIELFYVCLWYIKCVCISSVEANYICSGQPTTTPNVSALPLFSKVLLGSKIITCLNL